MKINRKSKHTFGEVFKSNSHNLLQGLVEGRLKNPIILLSLIQIFYQKYQKIMAYFWAFHCVQILKFSFISQIFCTPVLVKMPLALDTHTYLGSHSSVIIHQLQKVILFLLLFLSFLFFFVLFF